MTMIVKGSIKQQHWGGKQQVMAINTVTSPLWPPDHLRKVQRRAEEWLYHGYTLPDDPRFDDYMTMLEETSRAKRCKANFRTICTAEITPHAHTPWFTVWGTLTGAAFTSSNLVEILYSPEWRTGIVRQAISLPGNRKPGRYYKKHISA